ncbi:MAG: hypothetical protein V9E94_04765 [Microthrixaceae bacterium]
MNVFGRRSEVADVAYRLVGALDDATVELAGSTAARISGGLLEVGDPVVVDVTTEHLRGGAGRDAAGRHGRLALAARTRRHRPAARRRRWSGTSTCRSRSAIADDAGQDVVDAVVELAVRVAGWTDGRVRRHGVGGRARSRRVGVARAPRDPGPGSPVGRRVARPAGARGARGARPRRGTRRWRRARRGS